MLRLGVYSASSRPGLSCCGVLRAVDFLGITDDQVLSRFFAQAGN